MGVPVFFKWLSTRNPKIIKDAIESQEQTYMATGNPLVDNFYIDMNGLIHPSCNPRGENIRIPTNFQEQCENIYEYIDKLMNIVRPRKLLYLAIDGVAPRAKMNQQRSRRFRAALEESAKNEKKQEVLERFKQEGAWSQQLQDQVTKKKFDSNVITPGTEFLSSVCVKLREYIKNRLENNKFWKNLTVVFSDANCPGEGQHKIMDFIRQQRGSESYTPDQSHCIYGADADLIMLSLATHEPKFYIIRQVVIQESDKFCTNCLKKGHYFMDCKQGQARSIEDESRIIREMNAKSINVKFQFLRIQMVREFIHINYMRSIIPFGYDLERIIDDFIFLCFFVGNDFLPHVPCLSIREGGIDVLMRVYEFCLSIMTDYITKAGELNMKSLKIFIQQMTYYEQSLIRQMIIRQANNKQRDQNTRLQKQRQAQREKGSRHQIDEQKIEIDPRDPITSFNAIMQRMNKEQPINIDDYSVFGHQFFGYKEKYYREKFKISPGEFLELKTNVSRSYLEALKWICGYYYKGVPSWSWFYPFHYSPFFTDLVVPDTDLPPFEPAFPFKPFEQLMAVLPARTCDAVPKFLHFYMKNVQSPIIDYYPSDFHIDLVGKKFAWLGEVILPFIDDKRLLSAIQNYETKLSEEEAHRNRFGNTNVYINKYGPLGRRINKIAKVGETLQLQWQKLHEIEGSFTVIAQAEDFLGFTFKQPMDRIHQVSLKQGTANNPLEQIDDVFISRTDKAAFGGIRYTRIVDRIIAERRDQMRLVRHASGNSEKEDRGDGNWRSRSKDDRERSRSREKRNYGRDRNYDNRDERNRYQGNRYNNNNRYDNNRQDRNDRNDRSDSNRNYQRPHHHHHHHHYSRQNQ